MPGTLCLAAVPVPLLTRTTLAQAVTRIDDSNIAMILDILRPIPSRRATRHCLVIVYPWRLESERICQSDGPDYRMMCYSIDAQRADNAQRAEKNIRLAAEVRDLKTGMAALEERARSEPGMIG